MTDRVIVVDLIETETGDHDRFAHFVYPKEAVVRAYIEGTAVTALCGKRWVPCRDPERYPICPDCKAIRERGK